MLNNQIINLKIAAIKLLQKNKISYVKLTWNAMTKLAPRTMSMRVCILDIRMKNATHLR